MNPKVLKLLLEIRQLIRVNTPKEQEKIIEENKKLKKQNVDLRKELATAQAELEKMLSNNNEEK